MDPFRQLPNEVLQEVFKHVPSLPGKFKLAAVNQKFRGAIMKMLGKQMDLKLNGRTINGIEVAQNKWPIAVEVLAECTDFKMIQIHRGHWPSGLLDDILHILIKTDSLNDVIQFDSHFGCDQSLLEQFLSECAKLSTVFLRFPISRLPHPTACTIDLSAALGGRALTHLELELLEYPLMELSAFFRSLQPNTLKSCAFNRIYYPLDLVQLVTELSGSAWAALERLHIRIYKSSAVQLELLGLAKQLPPLRTCIIAYKSNGDHSVLLPFGQIADALASFFNGPTRGEPLTLDHFYPRWGEVAGCALVNLIRQLKHAHPDLRFNHLRFGRMELAVPNLNLRIGGGLTRYCHNECVECHWFYLTVVVALAHAADWNQANAHLENHQLDRCKVGRVVDDLNGLVDDCEALSAVINEAQDLATITFESLTPQGHQFYIAVACGPCFYNSCLQCVVIV